MIYVSKISGQKPKTSSGLTCDALQKHDILNISEQPIRDGEMAVDGDAHSESGDTIKTFASDWTNCTNKSFSRWVFVC